ncbi:MAG TPA: class I SAM-dependent methyltransferase [Microlunatus sp.]
MPTAQSATQPLDRPSDIDQGPEPQSSMLTVEAAAERIFAAALGTVETFSIYLGDRLGWYRSLSDDGPATAAELASRTGSQERYAREWLEQQAASGLLQVEPDRRFSIQPGLAEAMLDEHSLGFIGPLPALFATTARQLDRLVTAYRDGGGVSWADLGDSAREGQAALNRPWFESALPDALHGIADLDQRLTWPGARIADVGCGGGWSTIALARTYPDAVLTGIDIDEPTVEMARNNVVDAGLTDRVKIRSGDARDLAGGARYDAVFAFECLHDMPYPVQVLNAMRNATEPDGQVVIMDEAVADTFTAPSDEIDRFMYGASLLVCLPDGMSAPDSAGTGTVMRRPVLESYATRAGFESVEVLPIEDFSFFRFYRLRR